MDKVDIVIIGAGVVGLAIADRLAAKGKEIVVVEKYDSFGRETSSRNSEVIHGGFYYKTGSLMAGLCVSGNRMLYELCAARGIPCAKCGKIVVANSTADEQKLHDLFNLGNANGVPGLKLCTAAEVKALEPDVKCRMGLLSASTGILDTHLLMKSLETSARQNGATMAYKCEALEIRTYQSSLETVIRDADGAEMVLAAQAVVNAAGLGSDKLAASAGIDIDAAGYRLHPCKGEYFSVSSRHKGRIQHLVYPAPSPISLGIHVVLGLNGAFRFGPNAFYVDKLDYDVDAQHQREFYDGAREFLEFIEFDDLRPDQSGIRPKLQAHGEAAKDFVIREESDRGLPGLVNLVGIESPGLTSSLAIAQMVEKLIDG
jgi:L-2-hydroxyglutarate oxidase LhgO